MNRERCEALIRDRLIFVKIATAAIWLSWLASIAISGFKHDIEGKPIGADHIAFYSAAKLINEGQGDRIYDNEFMREYQTRLHDSTGSTLDAYRNPPFYALIYAATARLPYLASFWIWTVIALLLLWFGLGWLKTEKQLSALILSMSFYPVFAVISFGQNSLLSFAAFCLTFRLMERNRFFLAGMASGLLLFKPQLLLGLGVWWMLDMRRYLRCWLGLAAAGSTVLVISLLFVPNETKIFVNSLSEIARYDGFMFYLLHNPRAFGTLIAFDDKSVGNIVGLVCSLAAIAFFIYFWSRRRDNLPVMFGAAIFLTLWASPHTMIYEWSLAIIPAVLIWDRVPEKRPEWLLIFSVAWLALFVSTPIAKILFDWTKDPQGHHGWAIQISVPVLGVVGAWVGRQLFFWRPGTSETSR